jgi:Ca2+/Na+ antiporter
MLGGITTNSRTVQIGSTFAAVVGIFPLLMLWDGVIGRIDGVILMLSFIIYTIWIFSKNISNNNYSFLDHIWYFSF